MTEPSATGTEVDIDEPEDLDEPLDAGEPVDADQPLDADEPLGREALEDRRALAIADMVETQRQLDAGEIDGKTAERLFAIYQERIVDAVDQLAELGPPPSRTEGAVKRNQHRVVAGTGIAAIALLVAGFVITGGGHSKSSSSLKASPSSTDATVTGTGGGTDLSKVTNEQMEAVIAQNPDVTGMRLALVERYMSSGTDADLKKASEHAHVALQQNPTTADRARALRDLGWVTALQGNPTSGADLLDQSLQIEPTDKNTIFFLARVRLDGLHDAPGAVTLLQQLLSSGIDDADVRKTVEDELTKARAQIKP